MTPDQIAILAESIKHLEYVVQRNWENLPYSIGVEGHEDLDLFCSDEDRAELELLTHEYPLVDVRSPMDDYYPEEIADMLLVTRFQYEEFFIPTPIAHFLALYYHNAVHKKDNPYGDN